MIRYIAFCIVSVVIITSMALMVSVALGQERSNIYPFVMTRMVDADTFDGEAELTPSLILRDRFRLYCINAPEKWSEEGKAMIEYIEGLQIERGMVELVEEDAFGRWLSFITPAGWRETLNKHLYERGAPLYHRLTRAERDLCLGYLED